MNHALIHRHMSLTVETFTLIPGYDVKLARYEVEMLLHYFQGSFVSSPAHSGMIQKLLIM